MWTDSLDENKFKITKLWKWPLEGLLEEMPRICCSGAVFSVIHSMASSALLLEKAYHLVCSVKMDELEVRVWSKIEWMTKRTWDFLLVKILYIETIWVHISMSNTYLLLFRHYVVSNSLWHHGLQHTGFPVLHYLLKFAQTHVHQVDDAIQTSHLLSPPSSPLIPTSYIYIYGKQQLSTYSLIAFIVKEEMFW